MNHPWPLYFLVGLGCLLLTLVLTPLCRWLARKLDVVDHPKEARKVHREAIPYLGGIPFYVAFLATVLFIEGFYPQYSQPMLFPMCLVGTLIVLMGLYDDVCDMSSLRKLIIELGLACLLFYWGFWTTEISHPLGGTIRAEWLAFIITPLWIAGVINAVNFSDGLDGLAGGLVFICAAAVFAIAYKNGQVLSCVLMACLMGSTLGFLRYNFNPASIFMGDAGALFLGFVLGASTLIERQKGAAVIALSVPLVVMGVPIIDTLLSFYRRLMRARKGQFFYPDRDHLHHRLLDLGLSQRQVVLTLYYMSICMGIMAYLITLVPAPYTFLVILLAALATALAVVVLRFIESLSRKER